MNPEVQHQLQIIHLPLHVGSGHNRGDGYALVPIDIAIDAGGINKSAVRLSANRVSTTPKETRNF